MEALQREYEKLLNAQRFDPRELDYSVLERHISQLTLLSQVSNSGITVFDMYTRRHAFASYNFAELFQYDLESIATEDSDYFTGRIHPRRPEGIAPQRHCLSSLPDGPQGVGSRRKVDR